jgi:DNA-binding PadR family transcriptional regulator
MNSEFLRAALEPILLETIAGGASYGYEIARAVQEASSGKLLTQEGTLYPALHRLEKQKLLKATWKLSPEGRRRKHYHLTTAGKKRLDAVRGEWRDFSSSVNRILGLTFGRA